MRRLARSLVLYCPARVQGVSLRPGGQLSGEESRAELLPRVGAGLLVQSEEAGWEKVMVPFVIKLP